MSIKQRFEQEPIYLMDGSAFVYRGFYANQSMQRSDGFPTSALFIVARILMRILREEQPRHFAFVLDGHGPNFRHELFPLYKAQRSATPEDLIKQIDPIHRLIKALGLHLEVSDSCEADDCLASLAKRYREEHPVILVATDKDLKQCLHDNVMMWDPASRDEKIVTLKSFEEETGLRPTQWPDVQAIIGDSSDNIPGVRGVGPKTAEKLFHEYASLEAIRDGFASMKPALQKKFDGQLEAMFLYRQLTTLDTSRCASLTLDAMRVRPVNRQEAATLLREFELSSLERELATLIRDGRVAVEHDASETVDSGKSGSMRQLSLLDTPKAEPRQRLRDASDPFFDALEGNPVAVLGGHGELAIAVGDKEIVYTGLTPKLVDRLLKAKFVIAPDVKALLHTHADWGRIPPEKWFDLGLASYLLEPEDRDYGWPKLSARWGTALGLSAANPGLLALTMTDQLLKRLSGAHLVDLMKTLELPLIPVLADMESAGVKLDAEALAGFLEEVQKDLDRITEDVYREAQGPFNIRSAQQLGDVLFNRLKLPISGKTRGGQAAALAQILQVVDDSHQMQMLLGVLKGGGDLPGSLSGIPQLNSQPHQQALAQADVLGIHKEDVVHIGHVCGQPGALAGAGQLMGEEDAHHFVPGGSRLKEEALEQLGAGLAGGGQLVAAGHHAVIHGGGHVHAVPEHGAVLQGDVQGDDGHAQLLGFSGQDVGCGIGKNADHSNTSNGAKNG